MTDTEREYWTTLFVEEFSAEFGGDDSCEADRRALIAQSSDDDRENRAAVGRLRQEVRLRFFTEKGYVERPDSLGIMRLVDPDAPPSAHPFVPRWRPDLDDAAWRRRGIMGIVSVFMTLLVFALILGC